MIGGYILRKGENMRVGIGYDVHKLVENRDLIIGGVKIEHEYGLLGHSDADVLVHAIMDALLGAAALGDIGKHFPDTDEKYNDASSIELLKHVGELLLENFYTISNIDSTIIAQEPKMKPHIGSMREKIAQALSISLDMVNVKATTEEGLGFTGTKEGISAQAIAMISTLDIMSEAIGPGSEESKGCSGCGGCPMHKQ